MMFCYALMYHITKERLCEADVRMIDYDSHKSWNVIVCYTAMSISNMSYGAYSGLIGPDYPIAYCHSIQEYTFLEDIRR
jgi:hypothetical protein